MYVHTYLLTYLLFGVYTFLRLTVWTAEWLNVIILGLLNDIWIWNSKFVDSHACHLRRSCTTVAQRIWWRRWVELLRAARRRIRAEKTRVRNLDWCPRPKSNWQTVRGRAEWGGGERRRDGGSWHPNGRDGTNNSRRNEFYRPARTSDGSTSTLAAVH